MNGASMCILFLLSTLPAAAASAAGLGEAASRSNAPTASPPESPHEPTSGDPVGVFTGNAYETAEDLRVVCPDLDLVMFRSYSSGSMREGTLGFGWTHAYEWRVVRDGGRVVVHASGERGPSDVLHVFSVPRRAAWSGTHTATDSGSPPMAAGLSWRRAR